MENSIEYEFVVFEEKVGVIIKATDENINEKISEAKEILKRFKQSKSTISKEISTSLEIQNASEIAKSIGIDESKFSELFEIDYTKNKVYLVGEVNGKSLKDKIRNSALMVLTLYQYTFNRAMNSSELIEILKNVGLPINHMAEILKEERRFVIVSGSTKRDVEYKLTQLGKREGLNLIFEHFGLKTESKDVQEQKTMEADTK